MSGYFTIPTRFRVTAAQREQLNWLLRERGIELDELITDLVTEYLAGQPLPPSPAPIDRQSTIREQLRLRRNQLRMLRPQLHDPHNPPPEWLRVMIAELEEEIARLELELQRDD
ncbi:hypothetical protein QTO31_18975 [Chloroflexus sp. MS-CIW-1]|jgi:hypothetical protein|uniref:hypothetical protein n=1 Tax=Chloroflexus sp. MS-CIW-1 TaxID=3055768 RepID=UPI002648A03E|nr:hypothetical protein [Chloroflexus sp. MS-CIW-1]MDN5274055.1 hypothetical protein [Chloroflexus sp. MS-CIW-1]